MKKATKDQIRNVVILLSSAVLCGIGFSLYILHQYGPSGQYLAANTILSPAVMEQINDLSDRSSNQKQSTFVFRSIEFSYFNEKHVQKIQVDLPAYEKFYQMVAGDKSIENIQAQIEKSFSNGLRPALMITMQSDTTRSHPDIQLFQMIQFAEDDYYRVQLIGHNMVDSWAYFYHPGLYQEALKLFTNTH